MRYADVPDSVPKVHKFLLVLWVNGIGGLRLDEHATLAPTAPKHDRTVDHSVRGDDALLLNRDNFLAY